MWNLFGARTPDPESSDEELLPALARGEEAAFVIVYRRRHNAVYRYALQMTGSAETAGEVTQEVFLELLRGAARLDPALGSVRSWLYAVARRKILRQLSADRRYEAFQEDDAEPADATDLYRQFADAQLASRIREVIAGLPAVYREVLALCVLNGLSYADAAGIAEVPEGTIRSRLHRAKALIAERLGPEVAAAKGVSLEKRTLA